MQLNGDPITCWSFISIATECLPTVSGVKWATIVSPFVVKLLGIIFPAGDVTIICGSVPETVCN